MHIDRLASSGPTFSFEFFPPKTQAGEENLRAALAELRGLDPSFVSVTYGAGGSTRGKTIEIVKRIRDQYGLEAMNFIDEQNLFLAHIGQDCGQIALDLQRRPGRLLKWDANSI